MQLLPLTIERQQTEWSTIKNMAQNNNFPQHFTTSESTNETTKSPSNTGQRRKQKRCNLQKQKLESSSTSSNIPT
jgi:hypothetical protein